MLLALLLALSTVRDVKLEVTPRHALAPVTVRARVMVQPHDDNRNLCLEWETGSSCEPLEGQLSRITHYFKVQMPYPGEFHFVARVYRTFDKVVRSEERSVTVIESIPQ